MDLYISIHGNENSSHGGPSTRSKLIADQINRGGASFANCIFISKNTQCYEPTNSVVWILNSWPYASALREIKRLKLLGNFVVFSPILMPFYKRALWEQHAIKFIINNHNSMAGFDRWVAKNLPHLQKEAEARKDHLAVILNEQCAFSDLVTLTSDFELQLLESLIPAKLKQHVLLKNCCKKPSRPKSLSATGHPARSLLSFGSVQRRKNQFLVVEAIQNTEFTFTSVGHVLDRNYYELVKSVDKQDKWTHLEFVENGSQEFEKLFQQSFAAINPSFSECASVFLLEAAQRGLPIFSTITSSETEYFGQGFTRFNAFDPKDLRNILIGYQTSKDNLPPTASAPVPEIHHELNKLYEKVTAIANSSTL